MNETIPLELAFFFIQHALESHPSCCVYCVCLFLLLSGILWYVCTVICLTIDLLKNI